MINLVLLLKPNIFNSKMISTNALILRVSDITEHGVHIGALQEPQWLENLPELWSEGSEIKLISKVGIDLNVTRVLNEVTVIGNLKLTIETPCSRCVEAVKIELNPLVSLVLTSDDLLRGEERDLECETYQGDEVDLNNYLREQVAMSLPLKVVCDEICKGLCTICGANLNKDGCDCERDQIDPRFAVLKDLKI